MKEKFLLAAALAFSAAAYAQQNVGINTSTPQATLDVAAKNPSDPKTSEGVLIPRLSKADLDAKDSSAYGSNQNGTLVFVNDVSGTGSPQTADITATGFYYYDNDAAKWVKISGASTAATGDTVWYSGTPVTDTTTSTAATGYTGAMFHNDDIYANSVRVGRGNGNDDTNTVAGEDALLLDQPNPDPAQLKGIKNTAVGFSALKANTTGTDNTAVGYNALPVNDVGSGNTAVGENALADATDFGSYNNVAVGSEAGSLFAGAGNVIIGAQAGNRLPALNSTTANNTTARGDFNVLIGYQTNPPEIFPPHS